MDKVKFKYLYIPKILIYITHSTKRTTPTYKFNINNKYYTYNVVHIFKKKYLSYCK